MAWPSEAGALGLINAIGSGRKKRKRIAIQPVLLAGAAPRGRFYADARGLYRVANAAEFRFYRKLNTPPIVGTDTPYATNATLPYTPSPAYSDGTWYVGVTWFNGFVESDFISLTRLDIAGGVSSNNPPSAPSQARLEQRAGGVVRASALYWPVPDGTNKATQWALWFTVDGSTPNPAGVPNFIRTMKYTQGFDVLQYNLPAQTDSTAVKVLIRTRRLDGASYVYSQNATILTVSANANGPGIPMDLEAWRGKIPEDE